MRSIELTLKMEKLCHRATPCKPAQRDDSRPKHGKQKSSVAPPAPAVYSQLHEERAGTAAEAGEGRVRTLKVVVGSRVREQESVDRNRKPAKHLV